MHLVARTPPVRKQTALHGSTEQYLYKYLEFPLGEGVLVVNTKYGCDHLFMSGTNAFG